MRVLSLPSRHPYIDKFNKGGIKFVNPGTDYFSERKYEANLLHQLHPPKTYDIVHIHFSFDKVPLDDFEALLKYFRQQGKPVVWTCHSRESQRVKNLGKGKYQQLLFYYSDLIISPTRGCREWIYQKFGNHKRDVRIVPLGYMADPKEVRYWAKKIRKDRNLFTYLIGDFRENKEIFQSIVNFLQCTALEQTKLQLIFKPISTYKEIYGDLNNLRKEMLLFFKLVEHPRIINISLSEIPNEVIIKAFLASHAIILPYKWGTHSGQIELAKDCGCHVVASNVGYYSEQWDEVCLWNTEEEVLNHAKTYTNALIDVYQREPLTPAVDLREKEFEDIFKDHLDLYKILLEDA